LLKAAKISLWVTICALTVMAAPHLAVSDSNNKITQSDMLKIEKTETDKYWEKAYKEVYKSLTDLNAQDQIELARNEVPRKLMHGNRNLKEIAITFDDGPHPKYTPVILDILRRNKVKATFFLVGMLAEKYPNLVKAEMKAGHSVGNHTYHHVSLTKIPEKYIATEIESCGDVLRKAGHKSPHLFRPPGGDYNKEVADIANYLGYTLVLWTDDPGDYLSPGKKVILSRLMRKLDNGGIILIHDGISQTVDILPELIRQIRKRGYTLVTIDQYLDHKGTTYKK